jgi:PKD repeat protein
MLLISPPLAVKIEADESAVKNDSGLVCDFIAKPVQGPSPLTVTFQDRSIGNITHWYWEFGDNSSSRRRHPVHEYLNVGQYSVSLTVKGPAGISELVKGDYIKVMTKP